MARAHCMLDTKGYRHTLRICNTYCFSTATVIARTRPIVPLYVHCLFCLSVILIPFLNSNRTRAFIIIHQSKHSFFVSCLYICALYVSASSSDTPDCRKSLGTAGLECCNEVFSFHEEDRWNYRFRNKQRLGTQRLFWDVRSVWLDFCCRSQHRNDVM